MFVCVCVMLLPADRNDGVQSTSSSSESLSSRSSRELPQPLPSSLSSSPQTSKRLHHSGAPPKLGANGPHRDYRVQQTNHYAYNSSTSLAAFASTSTPSLVLLYTPSHIVVHSLCLHFVPSLSWRPYLFFFYSFFILPIQRYFT